MLTIAHLVEVYPIPSDYQPQPGCHNNKLTGPIPIAEYLYREPSITAARKAHGKVRVVYRGPRIGNSGSTSRGDATHVVLYKR